MSKNRLSLNPRLPLHNTIFTKPFRWNCIWFLFKNDLVRYTFWLILIYLFIRFFMSINSTCLDFKMLRFSYLSSSYCKIRLRALLIEWFKRVEHAVDKPLTKAMHLGPFIEWFIAIGWSNYYHFIYVSHVLLYRLLKSLLHLPESDSHPDITGLCSFFLISGFFFIFLWTRHYL